MKSAIFITLIWVFGNPATAININEVFIEVVGAGTFAAVYEFGKMQGTQHGHLAAAVLVPATFQFDDTSKSVGLSMANLGIKEWLSEYVAHPILVEAGPVLLNGAAYVSYTFLLGTKFGPSETANLFGKKALYGSSDVVEKIVGGKLASAILFVAVGSIAAGLGWMVPAGLFFENAGLLVGDWLYSADNVQAAFLSLVLPVTAVLSHATTRTFLSLQGHAFLPTMSGFALASFSALLEHKT